METRGSNLIKCVYVRESANDERFIICLCVDDLLLVKTDEDELVQFKRELSQMFDVKDLEKSYIIIFLGELHYFLSDDGLYLSLPLLWI